MISDIVKQTLSQLLLTAIMELDDNSTWMTDYEKNNKPVGMAAGIVTTVGFGIMRDNLCDFIEKCCNKKIHEREVLIYETARNYMTAGLTEHYKPFGYTEKDINDAISEIEQKKRYRHADHDEREKDFLTALQKKREVNANHSSVSNTASGIVDSATERADKSMENPGMAKESETGAVSAQGASGMSLAERSTCVISDLPCRQKGQVPTTVRSSSGIPSGVEKTSKIRALPRQTDAGNVQKVRKQLEEQGVANPDREAAVLTGKAEKDSSCESVLNYLENELNIPTNTKRALILEALVGTDKACEVFNAKIKAFKRQKENKEKRKEKTIQRTKAIKAACENRKIIESNTLAIGSEWGDRTVSQLNQRETRFADRFLSDISGEIIKEIDKLHADKMYHGHFKRICITRLPSYAFGGYDQILSFMRKLFDLIDNEGFLVVSTGALEKTTGQSSGNMKKALLMVGFDGESIRSTPGSASLQQACVTDEGCAGLWEQGREYKPEDQKGIKFIAKKVAKNEGQKRTGDSAPATEERCTFDRLNMDINGDNNDNNNDQYAGHLRFSPFPESEGTPPQPLSGDHSSMGYHDEQPAALPYRETASSKPTVCSSTSETATVEAMQRLWPSGRDGQLEEARRVCLDAGLATQDEIDACFAGLAPGALSYYERSALSLAEILKAFFYLKKTLKGEEGEGMPTSLLLDIQAYQEADMTFLQQQSVDLTAAHFHTLFNHLLFSPKCIRDLLAGVGGQGLYELLERQIRTPDDKGVGFVTWGNTCWLNTALQTILRTVSVDDLNRLHCQGNPELMGVRDALVRLVEKGQGFLAQNTGAVITIELVELIDALKSAAQANQLGSLNDTFRQAAEGRDIAEYEPATFINHLFKVLGTPKGLLQGTGTGSDLSASNVDDVNFIKLSFPDDHEAGRQCLALGDCRTIGVEDEKTGREKRLTVVLSSIGVMKGRHHLHFSFENGRCEVQDDTHAMTLTDYAKKQGVPEAQRNWQGIIGDKRMQMRPMYAVYKVVPSVIPKRPGVKGSRPAVALEQKPFENAGVWGISGCQTAINKGPDLQGSYGKRSATRQRTLEPGSASPPLAQLRRHRSGAVAQGHGPQAGKLTREQEAVFEKVRIYRPDFTRDNFVFACEHELVNDQVIHQMTKSGPSVCHQATYDLVNRINALKNAPGKVKKPVVTAKAADFGHRAAEGTSRYTFDDLVPASRRTQPGKSMGASAVHRGSSDKTETTGTALFEKTGFSGKQNSDRSPLFIDQIDGADQAVPVPGIDVQGSRQVNALKARLDKFPVKLRNEAVPEKPVTKELVSHYVQREWKAETVKARHIRQAYMNFGGQQYVVGVRGDNFCGLRALLVKNALDQRQMPFFNEHVNKPAVAGFVAMQLSEGALCHTPWARNPETGLSDDLSDQDYIVQCLEALRNNVVDEVWEGKDAEQTMMKKCEALKFLLICKVKSLYQEQDQKALLHLVVNGTNENFAARYLGELTHIGITGGIQQGDLYLLAELLGVREVFVVSLTDTHKPGSRKTVFGSYNADSPFNPDTTFEKVNREAVKLVTEDGRHYKLIVTVKR